MERKIMVNALETHRDQPEGLRISEMIAGRHLNAIDLSIDEAVDLAADITYEVANLRRGRIIDGLAWCARCGKNTVALRSGVDTCHACGKEA